MNLSQRMISPEPFSDFPALPFFGSCNMGQPLIWPCIPWITNPPTTPLSQPLQHPKIRSTAPPPASSSPSSSSVASIMKKLSVHAMSDIVQFLFIYSRLCYLCLFTSVNITVSLIGQTCSMFLTNSKLLFITTNQSVGKPMQHVW